MSKTIMLESLLPDVQRAVEDILSSGEPVIIARDGQPIGRFEAVLSSDIEFDELIKEEEAAIMEDIRQSDLDFAAGRYLTLDDLKAKYAGRLQEGAS